MENNTPIHVGRKRICNAEEFLEKHRARSLEYARNKPKHKRRVQCKFIIETVQCSNMANNEYCFLHKNGRTLPKKRIQCKFIDDELIIRCPFMANGEYCFRHKYHDVSVDSK